MKLSDFDYHLPKDRIATGPARPREVARLLVVRPTGGFEDRRIADLPDLLRPGDCLVMNDTRVIPARLRGVRPGRPDRSGAPGPDVAVEATLHRRLDGATWEVFARPAKRLRPGDRIDFAGDFAATVAERTPDGGTVLHFDRAGVDLMKALEAHGEMPLPPYIDRPTGATAADALDYQTVYARHEGAVAAPTAGLHFTDALFGALDARGVERVFVTLHVGGGTFLPVKVDEVRDHVMHAEYGEVSADAAVRIAAVRARGGRVVAVGTTSLRLLESAARPDGTIEPFAAETDIFITPGYRFRAVDLLLTNFHLPRSTLLMLVAAFSGLDRIRAAYDHAIDTGYRFYSYGDACLLHGTGR